MRVRNVYPIIGDTEDFISTVTWDGKGWMTTSTQSPKDEANLTIRCSRLDHYRTFVKDIPYRLNGKKLALFNVQGSIGDMVESKSLQSWGIKFLSPVFSILNLEAQVKLTRLQYYDESGRLLAEYGFEWFWRTSELKIYHDESTLLDQFIITDILFHMSCPP